VKQKHFFALAIILIQAIIACQVQQKPVLSKKELKRGIVTVKETDSLIFHIALPPIDSTRIFPTTVVYIRKADNKPNFLEFEAGGTETNIAIVDSACAAEQKEYWGCPATKRLDFSIDESRLLDISELKRGSYIIRYGSCYIAGVYRLHLE